MVIPDRADKNCLRCMLYPSCVLVNVPEQTLHLQDWFLPGETWMATTLTLDWKADRERSSTQCLASRYTNLRIHGLNSSAAGMMKETLATPTPFVGL